MLASLPGIMTTSVIGTEIIQGLFREGQLVTLTGGFQTGKSPLLLDWLFAVTTGTPWCGKRTSPRPVLLLAHETPDYKFRADWNRLSEVKGVAPPPEPLMLEAYLEAGSEHLTSTMELIKMLREPIPKRLEWIAAKAISKESCIVCIDPFDMFFRVERKSVNVMEIYHFCRTLKLAAPRTTFLFTFNRRKKLRNATSQPSLLDDPHDWLEEASGHLEIQTRSDTRLGLDYFGNSHDGIRVLHGVRRGDDVMEPMFLESRVTGEDADNHPLLGGFQPVNMDTIDLGQWLSPRMQNAVTAAPAEFGIDDLVEAGLPRSSAYRAVDRMVMAGIAEKLGRGQWRKRV